MRKNRYILLIWIALFFIPFFQLDAQFYNGHQMKFGKNRVQFNTFYWKYYRFDRYDVYSYEEGTDLSLYVADYLEGELERIERFFDYNFEKRLIFIVYNKLSDFKQSNIGQLNVNEEEEANVGGLTRIIQNKIFVYFEGDHNKLEKQVTKTLSEALIYEMLYGNDFKDNFTSSTLLNLPEWFVNGLVSYMSDPWGFELENRVKDGILSGRFDKFNRLEGKDAVYAGHSFWKYISDNYGESIIPNILYLTRINKNASQAFMNVLGFKIRDLSKDWLLYYKNMYENAEEYRNLPAGERAFKPRKNRVYREAKISPDGNYIAYVTNQLGRYKVFLYDTRTGKKKKLEKDGHKIEQITDYSYPILAWHPSGRILTWVEETKGELRLTYYDLDLDEYSSRLFLLYEKILDFDYSHDGLKFVISGIVKGQTDIFVHDIASANNERITNDIADDMKPRFSDNSTKIVFSSNRVSDTLGNDTSPESITDHFSVFIYDYQKKDNVLRRISDGRYNENTEPYPYNNNQFLYLSDQSGIVNRYLARYDSAISFIDTTVHYRYFSRTYPITNYKRNILEHHYQPKSGKYSEIVYNDGKYNIYSGDIEPVQNFSEEISPTSYREKLNENLSEEDSLSNIVKKTISMSEVVDNSIVSGEDTINLDFTGIDINNYVFEREKLNYYNKRLSKVNLNLVIDTVKERPRLRYIDYETSFYPNYLVNQVDFSFLNESYQVFTGGAVYYNPGFNMLFKVGANDLFEDYRLIGGVRFATDFNSNEYLLSFEDLKNRWDKQVIFHRQVFQASTQSSLVKTYMHELMYSMKYPFSQVAALKATALYRNDRSVFLSTDLQNMNEPDIVKPWAGLKLEYIFDNTRPMGLNLYEGLRFKIFAEGYKQIDQKKSDLVVVGADFRHYTRIHRSFIWANRFAASSSFGNTPLIYYLGSVDNWTNLSTRIPTFDESVPIDYSKNYAFQTLATNMRGFSQNIRNGNNFALVNTELRLPLIRYLLNRPISSSFLNNFQVIGFFDAGTAWTGLHPWTGENEYNIEEYENGPVRVIIDSNREPLVAGYGYGLRSRLFGYFIRVDWAWGIENRAILPRIFYFSLNLDF